jgi:hypothetical protein
VFKITHRTYYQWIEILETSGSVKVEIRRIRRDKTSPDALKKTVETVGKVRHGTNNYYI